MRSNEAKGFFKRQNKTLLNFVQNSKHLARIPLTGFWWASIGTSTATLMLIALAQTHLPPQVPVFYGLPETEEQLTSSLGLSLPAILSLGIFLLNTFFIYLLKDEFLQKILVLSSFAVSLFSLVSSVKIMLLVGNF